jgi:hypothetical protein
MIIWTIDTRKKFKLNIEGTLRLKFTASRLLNMKEFESLVRKRCGLGKDAIITGRDMELFNGFASVYEHEKKSLVE